MSDAIIPPTDPPTGLSSVGAIPATPSPTIENSTQILSNSSRPAVEEEVSPEAPPIQMTKIVEKPKVEQKPVQADDINKKDEKTNSKAPAAAPLPTPSSSPMPAPLETANSGLGNTIKTEKKDGPEHPSVAMTTSSGSNKSKFGVFISALIIFVLLIWASVAYLFVTNSQLKKDLGGTNTQTADSLSTSNP